MLARYKNAFLTAVIVTAILFPGLIARAQGPTSTPPTLTYFVEQPGVPGSPSQPETVLFTLNGYTNDSPLTDPNYNSHFLYALVEADFEQAGGVVVSGFDVTPPVTGQDQFPLWDVGTDLALSTPTNPIKPRDPRYFRITSTIPQVTSPVHLYSQEFWFFTTPHPDSFYNPPGGKTDSYLRENDGHPIFATPGPDLPAVPEPAGIASFALGGAVLLAFLLARRRKVRAVKL